jgi:hypothetical protein
MAFGVELEVMVNHADNDAGFDPPPPLIDLRQRTAGQRLMSFDLRRRRAALGHLARAFK